MDALKFPKVHQIMLKSGGLLEVDIDRYTMWFQGHPEDHQLQYRSGMVHGKRDPAIAPDDTVALVSMTKARFIAMRELRTWARENPGMTLNGRQEVLIWLAPSHQPEDSRHTPLSSDHVQRLIKKVSRQMKMFPDDEPLP